MKMQLCSVASLVSSFATLLMFATPSLAQSQPEEDSFLHFEDRDQAVYTQLGLKLRTGDIMDSPGGFINGTSEFALSGGYWLHPLMAVEGQVYAGSGSSQELFGYGHANTNSAGGRLGLKLAIPYYITPVLGGYVEYGFAKSDWFTSRDSRTFGNSTFDNPYAGTRGTDRHHMLGATVETGLDVNYGSFTGGFYLNATYALAHSSERSNVRATYAFESDADPGPLTRVGLGEFTTAGLELRGGFRF